MKRNIALTMGAILLTAVGVFVGKANTRFAGVSAYFTAGGACREIYVAGSPSFFTNSSTGHTRATILTAGGANANIYSTSTCGLNSKAYFTH
jgi:hypothetical protein